MWWASIHGNNYRCTLLNHQILFKVWLFLPDVFALKLSIIVLSPYTFSSSIFPTFFHLQQLPSFVCIFTVGGCIQQIQQITSPPYERSTITKQCNAVNKMAHLKKSISVKFKLCLQQFYDFTLPSDSPFNREQN